MNQNIVPKNERLFCHNSGGKNYCYGNDHSYQFFGDFQVVNSSRIDFPYQFGTNTCYFLENGPLPICLQHEGKYYALVGQWLYCLDGLQVSIVIDYQQEQFADSYNKLFVWESNLYAAFQYELCIFQTEQSRAYWKKYYVFNTEASFYVAGKYLLLRYNQHQVVTIFDMRLRKPSIFNFIKGEKIFFEFTYNNVCIFTDRCDGKCIYYFINCNNDLLLESVVLQRHINVEYEYRDKWQLTDQSFRAFVELFPKDILTKSHQLPQELGMKSKISDYLLYKVNDLFLAQHYFRNNELRSLKQLLHSFPQLKQLILSRNYFNDCVQYTKGNMNVVNYANLVELLQLSNISRKQTLIYFKELQQQQNDIALYNFFGPQVTMSTFSQQNDLFITQNMKQFILHISDAQEYLHLLNCFIAQRKLLAFQQAIIYYVEYSYDYSSTEDTILSLCIRYAWQEGVNTYLRHCDIPECKRGDSFLIQATKNQMDIKPFLHLSGGRDINGMTALMHCRTIEDIKVLSHREACLQDANGKTALMHLIGMFPEVVLLLENEINYLDNSGFCCLDFLQCISPAIEDAIINLLDRPFIAQNFHYQLSLANKAFIQRLEAKYKQQAGPYGPYYVKRLIQNQYTYNPYFKHQFKQQDNGIANAFGQSYNAVYGFQHVDIFGRDYSRFKAILQLQYTIK